MYYLVLLKTMLIRIRLAILMPIQLRVWIPDWHQNNVIQNVNLSPSFTHFEKLGLNFFTFIHSNGRLKYISFHMSGKCVMILIILDSILKFSLKSEKYMCLELVGSGSACPGYQSWSGSCKIMGIWPYPDLVILDRICKNMIILPPQRNSLGASSYFV